MIRPGKTQTRGAGARRPSQHPHEQDDDHDQDDDSDADIHGVDGARGEGAETVAEMGLFCHIIHKNTEQFYAESCHSFFFWMPISPVHGYGHLCQEG
jgi:hypothetical protein